MNKKIILTAGIILIYIYFIYNPIIIEENSESTRNDYLINTKKGDSINLFDSFDFDSGDWKVCIIINERYNISPDIPYGKYLYTADLNVIKKFKKLSFEYTKADVATILNEIIFYKDDEIVYRSYIVLDERIEGLQKDTFGWLKGNDSKLALIVKDFKLKLLPIVYI